MTLRRYTKLIAAAAALTLAAAVPAVADPDSIEVSTATVVEDAESLDVQEDPEDGNIESDDDGSGGNDDDAAGSGTDEDGDESELGGEGVGDPEVQESDGDSDISLLTLPSEPTTITIANITDFHGRIDGPGGAARLLRGGQPGGDSHVLRRQHWGDPVRLVLSERLAHDPRPERSGT